MSLRTLDTASGANGGAIQLAQDPGRARNIHVTGVNIDATNAHAVFFGRNRRELAEPSPTGRGIPGFALPIPSTGVSTFQPGMGVVGGVSYASYILQGWVGELWAAADVTGGVVQVDVFDAGSAEK